MRRCVHHILLFLVNIKYCSFSDDAGSEDNNIIIGSQEEEGVDYFENIYDDNKKCTNEKRIKELNKEGKCATISKG